MVSKILGPQQRPQQIEEQAGGHRAAEQKLDHRNQIRSQAWA
jgi:hypothetical protein